MKGYFKGRYFKHQKNGVTICFITGQSEEGSFVQVISNDKVWQYDSLDGFKEDNSGITVDLPDIKGFVGYQELTPLSKDIMGPFRFLPMQCRHEVFSMRHRLSGGLSVDGRIVNLTDGTGYMEGDRGHSFPKEYLWLQCNDFKIPCSIMASAADIPFAGYHFMGCICAILFEGREYRLATYKGVKICYAGRNGLELKQGDLRLKINIWEKENQPLKSPLKGRMSGIIHESNCTHARFRFWKKGKMIFDLASKNVSFECNLTEFVSIIHKN